MGDEKFTQPHKGAHSHSEPWDVEKAVRTFEEFKAEQRRLHLEKLARRKAEREAARKAAKAKPATEYPWMKGDREKD